MNDDDRAAKDVAAAFSADIKANIAKKLKNSRLASPDEITRLRERVASLEADNTRLREVLETSRKLVAQCALHGFVGEAPLTELFIHNGRITAALTSAPVTEGNHNGLSLAHHGDGEQAEQRRKDDATPARVHANLRSLLDEAISALEPFADYAPDAPPARLSYRDPDEVGNDK